MKKITIWRRFDSDTTPRGLGRAPTYHIDKPATSDWEMVWAEEVPVILPDGYEVAESGMGDRMMYDERGNHCHIIDNGSGHPAMVDEHGFRIRLDRLSDFRKAANLTQQQTADAIGVSIAHYQKIESGASPLSKAGFETVQKLAAAFSLTLDELAAIAQ